MNLSFNNKVYGNKSFSHDSFSSRLRKVFSIVKKLNQNNILDVGCTDGFICHYFNNLNLHTTGLDISPKAIKKAAKICNQTHIADISKPWPIKNNSIDIVFAGEVIEHIFETEAFLEESFRVTKPGGYLVLTTPNIAWWFNRIFFNFGLQPISSEIGAIHNNYGNPFKKFISPPDVAGHIRPFTYLALKDMLKESSWNLKKIHGTTAIRKKRKVIEKIDLLIGKFRPSLANALVVLCQKPKSS